MEADTFPKSKCTDEMRLKKGEHECGGVPDDSGREEGVCDAGVKWGSASHEFYKGH